MGKNKISASLPKIECLTTPIFLKRDDLFVFAAGFEERSIFFPSNIVAEPGTHSIVLNYTPFEPRNQISLALELVERSGASTEIIEYNRLDAGEAWLRILGAFKKNSNTRRRIIFDISGVSKLGILLALEAARQCNFEVVVIYAEAAEYRPSYDEYVKARQSGNILQPSLQVYSGVETVLCAPVLSSVAMQGQPVCLVSFMSFNENFTQTLLNRLNPSRLVLINGRPPIHTWREEATEWIHDRLLKEWCVDGGESGSCPATIATSTLHYEETVRALSRIYWDTFVALRMVVAPNGSKMQSIGTYIVKAIHADIHIEYPVARGYLDDYSYGIGSLWKLELGDLCGLIYRLREEEIASNLFI